jgi:hypothetical protein
MSKGQHGGGGSGRGASSLQPVIINVTPLFLQRRKVVACDIDPPQNLKGGGHVKLSKDTAYQLQFNLQPGPVPGVAFRANKSDGTCDAFWSDPDDCPRNQTNDTDYTPTRINPTLLYVDVAAPGRDSCVNYRLNFENGWYFDPIIIHQ